MIEKVHGINATSVTLNARFTLLSTLVPMRTMRSRRLSNKSYNFRNQNFTQRAYHLQKTNRQIKQRFGFRNVSENNLPRLRKANSSGNIKQLGIKNRIALQHFTGNLRASILANASGMPHGNRLKFRGLHRSAFGHNRGKGGDQQVGRIHAGSQIQRGRLQRVGTRGGRQRGQGRGANTDKKIPTKEELDVQLETYMSNSPWALDKELDDYMKDAFNEE